ncbi:MAG: Rieske (2Fe-2S) protein [Melioribacteraceae bacterium]|nr:Rieske (2Fe-2S) protein [Melioribacteraceae bacterium]
MKKSKKKIEKNKKIEKKKTEEAQPKQTRRDFMKTAWKGLGIVAGLEFAGLTFYYLSDREVGSEQSKLMEIGLPDEFPNNSVTAFRQGHFYLIRMNDGGFIAVSLKCTHLGCSIIWDDKEKEFICPCHSSKFNLTGEVVSPPAPRALDFYSVKLINGKLSIDLNKKTKRDEFNKSQLTYI